MEQQTITVPQAQVIRQEASGLLDNAEAVYLDLHMPAGLAAVHALHNGARLEAQEKRRQMLLTRSGEPRLTPREMEVLKQLAVGKTNKEIAATLHISNGTVEQHISHIFARLGCDTRTQAVAIAIEHGCIKQ